ncbi:MAG TPA: mannitol dehydrogenase family protein [Acidimicrobiia bacterium]|nr:mannitol dehydrogenase family protein [Acidimicrobiia bacterium]
MTELPRLSARTLGAARAEKPHYDRTRPPPIVHVGVGAFARAHLGVYADDLLRRGWPATIRGVSLRSPRAEAQLAPQDALYTVLEREPVDPAPARVIGSFTSVATGAEAAIEAIASPSTRLVTLTVTEKGYEVPDGPEARVSAPAVIAAGLARRRAAGLHALVVASMDNLLDNGQVLAAAVLAVAERESPGLARWIADEVRFPTSVVDRMVPATSSIDVLEADERLRVHDEAVVVVEHHRSWVIAAAEGLPPLADVGVDVVADVAPYQRRKLWLLNGPHSALAYGGLLAGCQTVAEAAAHPIVAEFVQRYVDDVLTIAGDGLGADGFSREALGRFRNPTLGYTCRQVGADGSRKLPQRLVPPMTARLARGLGIARFAAVAAAWLVALDGLDDPASGAPRAARTDEELVTLALPSAADATVEIVDMLARVRAEGIAVLEALR